MKKIIVPNIGTVLCPSRASMNNGLPARKPNIITAKGAWPVVQIPFDWSNVRGVNLTYPMYANGPPESLGDCNLVAALHTDNTWSGAVGTESGFAESAVISIYGNVVPGNIGWNAYTLFWAWNYYGLCYISNTKIQDHYQIDASNQATIHSAIALFGPLILNFALADKWYTGFHTGVTWKPATPDPNLGHAVCLVGVTKAGVFKFISWATYAFFEPQALNGSYPSLYVMFSDRWFNAKGYAPNGFHYTFLAPLWTSITGTVLPASPFPPPTAELSTLLGAPVWSWA